MLVSAPQLGAGRCPDLVLLFMDGRSVPHVRLLADSRARLPAIPVILLAAHVDPDFAVELVKCGADDLLVVPPDPDGLRGKVLRALLGRPGPAFGWPALAPLSPRASDPDHATNVRCCYRASVPEHLQSVAVVDGAPKVSLIVRDLSVEVGERPAGMLLEMPVEAASRLPIADWMRGTPVSLVLRLGDDPSCIPVTARMRGPLRPGPQRSRTFGVQFTAAHAKDRERLQRFWMRCQRPVRKAKGAR